MLLSGWVVGGEVGRWGGGEEIMSETHHSFIIDKVCWVVRGFELIEGGGIYQVPGMVDCVQGKDGRERERDHNVKNEGSNFAITCLV